MHAMLTTSPAHHEECLMNRIAITLACTLLTATASAAGTDAQQKIANEIGGVASSAVSTYKQQGMAGLVSMSQDCWKNVSRMEFKCLRIDMAARYIDRQAGGGSAFPLNPYFDDDAFGKRAWALFEKRNADVNEANGYMAAMHNAMANAVDQAMKNSSASKTDVNSCVSKKMAKWDKNREKELDKWCRDLARKGQECRVSAGAEEYERGEAMKMFTEDCSR